jgi:hypothetical protein
MSLKHRHPYLWIPLTSVSHIWKCMVLGCPEEPLRSAIPVGFIGPSATTEMVERGEKVYKTVVIEETSEMLGHLVSESSADRWCFEHEQVRYVLQSV